ncbi:relaxase/mobilization nuclease domain-containing protein [Nocardia sp. NPDC058518]|uniref:relaxase/mobilization nuclease domain-containing protein n=1 Tax=Nocardia sp. NPDC058518 TaxID=3346534 RepID=UPI0036654058
MSGLLAYLVGIGDENANVHEHPHIVASHETLYDMGFDGDLSHEQALSIARVIDTPRRAHKVDTVVPNYLRDADGRTIVGADGTPVVNPLEPTRDGNVWHCSLSLHRDEGRISDEKWSAIAHAFVKKMELDDPSSARASARWVAIHHGPSAGGNDHIHIAASAVREDGTRVNTYKDFSRAHRACRELEEQFGLRVVIGRHDGRTSRGYHRAQLYAAARAAGIPRGQVKEAVRNATLEPTRDTDERIVRASLAASCNEAEFVGHLRNQGMLFYRSRDKSTGEVRGWCVGSPRDGARGAVLSSGGTIAKDLTLPRLRNNWDDTPEDREAAERAWAEAEDAYARYMDGDTSAVGRVAPLPQPLPAADRAMKNHAMLAEARRWSERFARIPATDGVAFAAAARQAAGVFSAWSLASEPKPGVMARAAKTLSRYAQLPAHLDGAVPSIQRRDDLSGWATILLASRASADPTLANAALLKQIGRTVEAISRAADARGEAGRARELADVASHDLDAVHARFLTAGGATATAVIDRSTAERASRIREAFSDTDSPRVIPPRATEPSRQAPSKRARVERREFDAAKFVSGWNRPATGPREVDLDALDSDPVEEVGPAAPGAVQQSRSAEAGSDVEREHERGVDRQPEIGRDHDGGRDL